MPQPLPVSKKKNRLLMVPLFYVDDVLQGSTSSSGCFFLHVESETPIECSEKTRHQPDHKGMTNDLMSSSYHGAH